MYAQVTLLMEMLNLEPWSYYPLTLQFLSTAHEPLRKGLPVPPQHIRIDFAPMDVSASLFALVLQISLTRLEIAQFSTKLATASESYHPGILQSRMKIEQMSLQGMCR